jgi:hypothetical protein
MLRASVPNFHGFTALVVMSSVAARYFSPQVGGLGVTVGQSGSVFRIDHDEKYNQTTHLPRIAPRHLFDVAIGNDDLFHGDRYKWSLRFTVINLTNKDALYNFLSTFSGTHFVSPRAYTAELKATQSTAGLKELLA